MTPGTKNACYREIVFITDDLGFRNVPGDRTRGNRVLLLGDSFGAGSGSSQDSTLASLLHNRYGVAAYNLSVAGASPWQELMTLKSELAHVHIERPAVVLWLLFGGNDLEEFYGDRVDAAPTNGTCRRLEIKLRTFLNRSPIKQTIERLLRARVRVVGQARIIAPNETVVERSLPDGRTMLFYYKYAQAALLQRPGIRRHRNYGKFRAVFEEMVRYCDAEDLKLIAVVVPSKEEVYEWVLRRREVWISWVGPSGFSLEVAHLCAGGGVQFLDLTPPW